MENKFLETISRSLNVELPYRETLDEYLDLIIPEIRQWGEDINETEHYSVKGGKPWMEIRDEENFHNTVVHFFNEGGEYLKSTDGNVSRGKWRTLEGTNKIIIEDSGMELYELAYLDSYFFILRKHGNQGRRRKYLVMGFEPRVSGLEWRDFVELLFNTYRSKHSSYRYTITIVIIIVILIVLFSIF